MRKTIMLVAFGLMFMTCKKDSVFDEYGFSGEGSALLNGQPWSSGAGIFPEKEFCNPDTCLIIQLDHFENGFLRGQLGIQYIPLSVGKQKLGVVWPPFERTKNQLHYGTLGEDGDVVTGFYYVYKEDDENYVDITELNLGTGHIRGNFQATVVRDSTFLPAGVIPDTIRITKGSFHGNIYWGKWQ